MVTKIEQYFLWHPERKILMSHTNHDERLDALQKLPESAAWEPEQVEEIYKSQGWKIAKATVKIEEI